VDTAGKGRGVGLLQNTRVGSGSQRRTARTASKPARGYGDAQHHGKLAQVRRVEITFSWNVKTELKHINDLYGHGKRLPSGLKRERGVEMTSRLRGWTRQVGGDAFARAGDEA